MAFELGGDKVQSALFERKQSRSTGTEEHYLRTKCVCGLCGKKRTYEVVNLARRRKAAKYYCYAHTGKRHQNYPEAVELDIRLEITEDELIATAKASCDMHLRLLDEMRDADIKPDPEEKRVRGEKGAIQDQLNAMYEGS